MKVLERKVQRIGRMTILLLLIILTVALHWDSKAYAVESWTGTVINTSSLNVRSGPGTNYQAISSLKGEQTVQILESGKDSAGKTWYKVVVEEGVTGWVSGAYLDVDIVTNDFQEYLTISGFPESYHAGLTALHEKYPNWVFEAQHTGLSWNDVIKAESKLGRNLVHKNSISSWKSLQTGAYNWETGNWVAFDGGAWVSASEDIIKYHMDPRNFFDEKYVFQFLRQSYDTTMDYTPSLTAIFSKSAFWSSSFEEDGVTKDYVTSVLEAGKISGVSPYTIASTVIQEQGWNPTSGSVSGASGYYNFFNAGAYEADGMGPVERGIWYAKQTDPATLRPWNTRTKSIAGGALIYGKNYVNVGQDTIYLKKFDVIEDGGLYNHQYMTNIQAAASEGKLLSDAFWSESASESTSSSSLVFKIPVYIDMPETPCVKPTGDGSPNNKLSLLSINGYSLTPTFSAEIQEYALIVPYEVSEIEVSAAAYNSKATISGTGKASLNVGRNVIAVEVKAENGDIRTYQLEVVREENDGSSDDTPSVLTSSVYNIDSKTLLITGVKQLPVKAEEFKKNLQSSKGEEILIQKADGTLQEGAVGTGNKVIIVDNTGKAKATYQVVIYGDVNGDGNIFATDYRIIKNQIMGDKQLLFDLYKKAADVDRDGNVYATDYRLIKNHIMEVSEISQK